MGDLKLTRPDAEIAYDVAGKGPVVVQLHGLTSSRKADETYFDFRGQGGSGRTLVRYDARGHGESTGPKDESTYTWPSLADDLFALLDVVADGPVDAIGSSMGTGTILTAAVQHPERFRRLVLCIPPTAWETRAAQAAIYRQMADLIEAQGWQALAAMMDATPALLPPVMAERGVLPEPQLVPELAPYVLRGSAASDLPTAEAIAELRMPVLILPWVADPGHPMSTAEKLQELIPGSELRVAEHYADVERWPEVVAEFLTS